jgi:protoporphyrinogen oxidase|tara:strand:+ start:85 stop:1476 length:1392 start_codon:yes stop_codon:yes gene_type:complete
MAEGKTKKRVIILGAGVTGLSAGIRFLDSGCDVCILEKAEHPGGLARTVVRGNYRLDIGPHHLFSQNDAILQEMIDLFDKEELVSFSRDAKIFFYDRFLDYPLTAKNVLLHMGLRHAFLSSASYIWTAFKKLFMRNSREDNFQDWASNSFGGYLYDIFFKPYTEQFWGIPCDELSVDCVPQVIKMSFLTTLKMIFLKQYEKESLSIAERETSLILFYPVKGIGAIVDKLEESFLSKGGTLKLNCSVSELTSNTDGTFTLNYQNETEPTMDEASHVISSIPISSLVRVLRPVPPASVLQSAKSLEYLSTIVLYIVIPDRDVLNCAYLYMMDRPYNRASNINHFHRQLSPEGENMLALEITCHFNDKTWKSSDDELFEKCIEHLESDGFVDRDEVKQFFTVRIKCAYPFYRLGYRKNLTAIFEYFKQVPGLTLAGRTGAYKYMDIDQCLEDTSNMVKGFKADGTL